MSDYGKLFSTQFVEHGRFAEAIAAADKEIAADPLDPEPLFNRARALVGLERYEEGVSQLEKAAGMDASASGMDAWYLDDVYFEALRGWALQVSVSDKGRGREILNRYLTTFPEGRHVDDLAKWHDQFDGVVRTWVKDEA